MKASQVFCSDLEQELFEAHCFLCLEKDKYHCLSKSSVLLHRFLYAQPQRILKRKGRPLVHLLKAWPLEKFLRGKPALTSLHLLKELMLIHILRTSLFTSIELRQVFVYEAARFIPLSFQSNLSFHIEFLKTDGQVHTTLQSPTWVILSRWLKRQTRGGLSRLREAIRKQSLFSLNLFPLDPQPLKLAWVHLSKSSW